MRQHLWYFTVDSKAIYFYSFNTLDF